jgi:hypothetical protein
LPSGSSLRAEDRQRVVDRIRALLREGSSRTAGGQG